MLEELHVKNLALIEDITIDFNSGFNVFSGETGAGKTVIVGALKLLLGDRASSDTIRNGMEEAEIEGRFTINSEEITVLRKININGKNKCYINGKMATVSALQDKFGPVVDLHGQHDHQKLLNSDSHAYYLDQFIGMEMSPLLEEYLNIWEQKTKAKNEYKKIIKERIEAEKNKDYLEFQLQELSSAKIRDGEDSELEFEIPKLKYSEKLASGTSELYKSISIFLDSDIIDKSAVRKAENLDVEFDKIFERYNEISIDLESLGEIILDYSNTISYNPSLLSEKESRLHLLNTIKRKYGPTIKDAIAKKEALENTLLLLEDGVYKAEEEAKEKLKKINLKLKAAGENIITVRKKYSKEFVKALEKSSKELNMPGSKFEVSFNDLPFKEWNINGPQKIEFMFTSNVGEEVKSLSGTASGGEISRVMLALKGVLGKADTTPILVFDEIDTGIGGKTAYTIGKKLKELASNHQVISITHLAQVAAFADKHLVVIKEEKDGRTITQCLNITGAEREKEIARMMSGKDDENSILAAKNMIENIVEK